jgi:hypothetical protein
MAAALEPRRRTPRIALLLVLSAVVLPAAARAECPPIKVSLVGRVTAADDGRPLKRLPIVMRIETENRGLPEVRFDAVITDAHGRFGWTREYPSEPCRDGGFFAGLPGRIWGRLLHPRDEAFRLGAERLPQRIRLKLPQRIRIISRDELLRSLDPDSRSARVRLDLAL